MNKKPSLYRVFYLPKGEYPGRITVVYNGPNMAIKVEVEELGVNEVIRKIELNKLKHL